MHHVDWARLNVIVDMPVYMYGRATDKGQEYSKDITADDELAICGAPVIMTIGELLPMVSFLFVQLTPFLRFQAFGPNDMDKRENKKPAAIL